MAAIGGGGIGGAGGGRGRRAARLLLRYWRSADWPFAWAATLALLAVELGAVWVLLWQNDWQRRIFEAIERREAETFAHLLLVFVGIASLQIALILAVSYLRQTIGLRWRGYLTRRYVARWMAGGLHAVIERDGMIDNPDQRIADDLRYIATGVLILAVECVTRLVSAVSFMTVLWRTSRPILLDLPGYRLSVPGDTIWYAVLYALVGSIAMVWIGRPFVRRHRRQQCVEGNFRADLVRVRHDRDADDAVARAERRASLIDGRFADVQRNQARLILASLGLTAGRSVYERVGAFLPLFLVAPRYFAQQMTFGEVMAARDAFWRLISDLSFFVQAYPRIAEQIANVSRVVSLEEATESHDRDACVDDGATGCRPTA